MRTVGASLAALMAVAVGVSACGSSSSGRVRHRAASYPVKVIASFPPAQRLAQRTDLVVSVTNSGRHVIPDVAVTITNPKYGTTAAALATLISARPPAGQQPLSSRSRPVWVIDREPGPCRFSCRHGGGPGGAVTSYADTWTLGRLAPGRTARFDWGVTAVKPGTYAVAYQVAAGLDSGMRAVLVSGARAAGRLHVQISSSPPQQHFTSSGQVTSGR